MTHVARFFSAERRQLLGMRIQKIGGVRGRLEISLFGVTEGTTKRRVHLIVAHEAVGHLRHVSASDLVGLAQSAMARFTGILRIQLRAQIPWRRKIRPVVYGARDHRRDVAQSEMLFVAERLQRLPRGMRGSAAASCLRRVLRQGAGQHQDQR